MKKIKFSRCCSGLSGLNLSPIAFHSYSLGGQSLSMLSSFQELGTSNHPSLTLSNFLVRKVLECCFVIRPSFHSQSCTTQIYVIYPFQKEQWTILPALLISLHNNAFFKLYGQLCIFQYYGELYFAWLLVMPTFLSLLSLLRTRNYDGLQLGSFDSVSFLSFKHNLSNLFAPPSEDNIQFDFI